MWQRNMETRHLAPGCLVGSLALRSLVPTWQLVPEPWFLVISAQSWPLGPWPSPLHCLPLSLIRGPGLHLLMPPDPFASVQGLGSNPLPPPSSLREWDKGESGPASTTILCPLSPPGPCLHETLSAPPWFSDTFLYPSLIAAVIQILSSTKLQISPVLDLKVVWNCSKWRVLKSVNDRSLQYRYGEVHPVSRRRLKVFWCGWHSADFDIAGEQCGRSEGGRCRETGQVMFWSRWKLDVSEPQGEWRD